MVVARLPGERFRSGEDGGLGSRALPRPCPSLTDGGLVERSLAMAEVTSRQPLACGDFLSLERISWRDSQGQEEVWESAQRNTTTLMLVGNLCSDHRRFRAQGSCDRVNR